MCVCVRSPHYCEFTIDELQKYYFMPQCPSAPWTRVSSFFFFDRTNRSCMQAKWIHNVFLYILQITVSHCCLWLFPEQNSSPIWCWHLAREGKKNHSEAILLQSVISPKWTHYHNSLRYSFFFHISMLCGGGGEVELGATLQPFLPISIKFGLSAGKPSRTRKRRSRGRNEGRWWRGRGRRGGSEGVCEGRSHWEKI